MKKISPRHYAMALSKLSESKDIDQIFANLMEVIRKNGDINKIEKIFIEFKKIISEKEEGARANITIALSESEEKILQLIKQITIPGVDKLSLSTNVDKNLLGGFVLRVKDVLIDASIKKQVNNLKAQLID